MNVNLSDKRRLGIVTLGAMKQYERIEKFLGFLRSWYLCYFLPDVARRIQTAAPHPYLDRHGSNINNVAQYMYRENKNEFIRVLEHIQNKLPGIYKIELQKFDNGQMTLKFWENGLYHHYLADLAGEMAENVGDSNKKSYLSQHTAPFL